MSFETNVFINCPFDEEYRKLIRPLIFEIIYLGFIPKLSQTISSSNIRVNRIKEIIMSCKYGIHDLSRSKASFKGELPRFNMPYELGLDIGALTYGNKNLKKKKILILETEKYHYQKVLSDIASQDIENHNNDSYLLLTKVRNWFSINFMDEKIPGQRIIWNAFNQFMDDLVSTLKEENYTQQEIDDMPIADFIKFSKDWIEKFR